MLHTELFHLYKFFNYINFKRIKSCSACSLTTIELNLKLMSINVNKNFKNLYRTHFEISQRSGKKSQVKENIFHDMPVHTH